jgi:acetolactate synthase-1/2/3 large subunit
VSIVTAGPGITDVVTAVANAQRAGVPMVCIGGAGPKALSDMGSLQDLDSVTLMRPICKWSVQVAETRRLKEYIDAAFRVAQSNLPGPVYLEIPLDVLMNVADDDLPATSPLVPPPRPAGAPERIAQAVDLLHRAQQPTFLVGSQIRWSEHDDMVERLADRIRVPFFLSGMARGALRSDHECLFSRSRRRALAQSDLIFVFGTPFDFRLDYGRDTTWNPSAQVVQVDVDAAELGRNRRVDVPIAGDSGLVMRELLGAARENMAPAWLQTLREEESKRQAQMEAEASKDTNPPNPLRVCRELSERLGSRDIVIGDGGDFVATASYGIKIQRPQLWMDPGPLGTLGVGPGYAMAAKLMRPDSSTVIVYGDGAFGLHAMEFEAMARQKIPVVAVIGNDAAWNQIRRGQVALYGEERAVATALEHTRYERVVEALGGAGFWVETVSELGPALDRAFSAGVPACVNVKIAPSDFRKHAISV